MLRPRSGGRKFLERLAAEGRIESNIGISGLFTPLHLNEVSRASSWINAQQPKADHLLQTPDTFIRSPLPGADGVEFIIHAAPQMGARFTQMTAEFVAGGTLGPAPAQRFLYVLDGKLEVKAGGKKHVSSPADTLICRRTRSTRCAPRELHAPR